MGKRDIAETIDMRISASRRSYIRSVPSGLGFRRNAISNTSNFLSCSKFVESVPVVFRIVAGNNNSILGETLTLTQLFLASPLLQLQVVQIDCRRNLECNYQSCGQLTTLVSVGEVDGIKLILLASKNQGGLLQADSPSVHDAHPIHKV
jgi:hypothetical protein